MFSGLRMQTLCTMIDLLRNHNATVSKPVSVSNGWVWTLVTTPQLCVKHSLQHIWLWLHQQHRHKTGSMSSQWSQASSISFKGESHILIQLSQLFCVTLFRQNGYTFDWPIACVSFKANNRLIIAAKQYIGPASLSSPSLRRVLWG